MHLILRVQSDSRSLHQRSMLSIIRAPRTRSLRSHWTLTLGFPLGCIHVLAFYFIMVPAFLFACVRQEAYEGGRERWFVQPV